MGEKYREISESNTNLNQVWIFAGRGYGPT